MKVLAIDPGFGRCGVAVLEGTGTKANILYSTCIETSAKLPFGERLLIIANELIALIATHEPTVLAIEELYFSNNQKTVFQVAEARGMILYLAYANHLRVVEYNPLSIKIALTGYGRASKEQVTKMVEKLIIVEKTPKTDDEYDAIAVGLTALAHERDPQIQGKK